MSCLLRVEEITLSNYEGGSIWGEGRSGLEGGIIWGVHAHVYTCNYETHRPTASEEI